MHNTKNYAGKLFCCQFRALLGLSKLLYKIYVYKHFYYEFFVIHFGIQNHQNESIKLSTESISHLLQKTVFLTFIMYRIYK